MNVRTHLPFAATAGALGVAGWSLGEQNGPGVVLALAAAIVFAEQAYRVNRKPAGHAAVTALPPSLRDLAGFVDLSAAAVLAEGRAAGVDAADRALDQIGDNTMALVEQTTVERVLELAFERETAGQGA